MKTFRDQFSNLNQLVKSFPISNEHIWPAPDEIEVTLQDYSKGAAENLQKALMLYERDYETRSATTFRQAMYRVYAIMCPLPTFKEAFPHAADLAARIGIPTGSVWPSPDILRSHIEERCWVTAAPLAQALALYGKAYRMEIVTSFIDSVSQVHTFLAQE